MNELGKLAGLMISFLILAILIVGLFYSGMHVMEADKKVNDAKKNVDAAKENLAQAYANIPWTIEHIIQDINNNVVSGQYDRATGDWLILRIQEIRNDSTP